MTISGTIAAIWRHPIKGFTPEALARVTLDPRIGVPFDRAWAVENGSSGFDPSCPAHISKFRFVALAPIPRAAAIHTRLNDATGQLTASMAGQPDLVVNLSVPADCARFEAWLTIALGADADGQLKVVQAPGHRFLDHPKGQVSITNLASVRALEAATGAPVGSRRLRGNIDVEGWPAFAEVDLAPGQRVRLGPVTARVLFPIQRCIAIHVNPDTAQRDLELVPALMALTGHANCGVYVQVIDGGDVAIGDEAGVTAEWT